MNERTGRAIPSFLSSNTNNCERACVVCLPFDSNVLRILDEISIKMSIIIIAIFAFYDIIIYQEI